MKVLTIVARILLGLIFVVFGLNAFLHFIPMPPPPQNLAGDYVRVFVASGYIYAVAILQIVCGLLLLIGRFVRITAAVKGLSCRSREKVMRVNLRRDRTVTIGLHFRNQ